MSGLDSLEKLFHPSVVASLKLGLPPVSCKIWKNEDEYEEILLDTLYPFDTLDTIKQTIAT